MTMAPTSITHEAGKGPRKRRNVSTRAYRDGWARIFGHRAAQLFLRLEPAAPDVIARDYWESLGGKVFWTEK